MRRRSDVVPGTQTDAEREHAAQHRIATWHHSLEAEPWGAGGAILRDINHEDDDPPVLMLRDREDWRRIVAAVEHAFACPDRTAS